MMFAGSGSQKGSGNHGDMYILTHQLKFHSDDLALFEHLTIYRGQVDLDLVKSCKKNI